MSIDVLVIWFLFALIAVLILISVKMVVNNLNLNKLADVYCKNLSKNLKAERKLFEKNSQKIILIDDLNEALFKRLFKITKELLFVQKLIFNNYLN